MRKKNIFIMLIIVIIVIIFQYYESSKYEIKINPSIMDFNGSKMYKDFTKKFNIEDKTIYLGKSGLNTNTESDDEFAFLLQVDPKGQINFIFMECYIDITNEKLSIIERITQNIRKSLKIKKSNYYVYSLTKINTRKNIFVTKKKTKEEYYDNYIPELSLHELLISLDKVNWNIIFDLLKESYPYNFYDNYYRSFKISNVYKKGEQVSYNFLPGEKKTYYLINKLGEIKQLDKDEKLYLDNGIIELKILYTRHTLYGGIPSNIVILLEISDID
ncbi:hypothetical protein [Caloranaerobacter sp. DY30410]|uniref:hypothetical protein n=1 Tax=Caloranaerobacter sp. DY30410 TaxID=3238305 RepID=UPI003D06AAB0